MDHNNENHGEPLSLKNELHIHEGYSPIERKLVETMKIVEPQKLRLRKGSYTSHFWFPRRPDSTEGETGQKHVQRMDLVRHANTVKCNRPKARKQPTRLRSDRKDFVRRKRSLM